MKPEQISVPPESEPSRTVGLTCSCTQRHVDAGRGAAVDKTDFSPLKSHRCLGESPERSTSMRYGAPTANRVAPVLAMTSNCRSGAFTVGEPPYTTTEAPQASACDSVFHTIHDVLAAT